MPHLSGLEAVDLQRGKSLSAWSVTECVKLWNKKTFHSNLLASGVFINRVSALVLIVPSCWHNSVPHQCLGTEVLLATSFAFPWRRWGFSALQLVLRQQSAGDCSLLSPGSLCTSHKTMCNWGCASILSPVPACLGRRLLFVRLPRPHRLPCLLKSNFPVQTSPALAQSHVDFCVPILSPAKCTPLLSRHQPRGSEEAAVPGACVWCTEFLCSRTQLYVPAWEGGAEVLDVK